MTTTTEFNYVDAGESFAGTPLYDVQTPAGDSIGYVARSDGKRGTTWMAYTPLALRSMTGFRNRDEAARYLARVSGGDQ